MFSSKKQCLWQWVVWQGWLTLMLLGSIPYMSLAQSSGDEVDLFAEDDAVNTSNAVSQKAELPRTVSSLPLQILWSGVLDARLVQTGTSVNWQQGGRGLSRYGGIDTDRSAYEEYPQGDRGDTSFKLSQASLVVEMVKNGHVAGHIQLNYDDHEEPGSVRGKIGIVEAFLKYEYDWNPTRRINLRLGAVIPPFSLEHPGTAWSSLYTITPSAINTWVGEELRPHALEVSYRQELASLVSMDFLLAAYSGNDPSASLLSWRGWALHDYQYTVGSHLKLQHIVPSPLGPKEEWEQPSKEMDGRLGVYTRAGFTLEQRFKMQVFYLNSLADPEKTIRDHEWEYSWQTNFTNVSLQWTPFDHMTWLAQKLWGNTWMGSRIAKGVDNDFDAWYVLGSEVMGSHRLSVRYDAFRVEDRDKLQDNNRSHGTAVTIAYLLSLNEAQIIGVEYLTINSSRKGNEGYLASEDPDDDLVQLMYRLTFY
ncbi:hypothetical protein WDW89_20215 [Deltaproteobacteria bacterium TL4]